MGPQASSGLVHLFVLHLPPWIPLIPTLHLDRLENLRVSLEVSVFQDFLDRLITVPTSSLTSRSTIASSNPSGYVTQHILDCFC